MASKSAASTGDLRVVILNQYYVPDVASTGQLLSELADFLVREGATVSVISTQPSYGPPETRQRCPRFAVENDIRVTRLWSTRFSKNNFVGRTVNSLTFLIQLMLRLLFRGRRGEVFLYTTNPPYLGVIGGIISLFRSHPYVVLLHDSYPQLTVLVGMIKAGGLIERVWHRCNRFMYNRAEQSIVLCRAAKRLVCETYGVDTQRVHIIHNWADPEKISPKPKTDNEFAREHGLVEPFTLLYSGNLGLYYEFETILRSAEMLQDESFRLVFIGAGGRRDWIAEQIEKRNLTNTLLLPYQPFDRLPDSLTACDASLVTIQEGVEGISYPSKLFASLAVGRPVLAISEPVSELYDQVVGNDVGYWFELGDAEGLADRIRKMIRDPGECDRMGRRARSLFDREYTRDASAAKYDAVLKQARAAE
jgi:glycosyltransferase involved in cell wall biosynthesis